MNALVVYDSQFGNTERIAQALAGALSAGGQARAVRVDPTQPVELQGVDVLIVGGPTQGWRATPATGSWLEAAGPERLRGRTVACFDTRFRGPRGLTGSAARALAKQLQGMGAPLLLPPESFFVKGWQAPVLYNGETDRAVAWGRKILEQVGESSPR
jgi:flavodoxin